MDLFNVDWTGAFARVGKGATRKHKSSVRIREEDSGAPILRGNVAAVAYGVAVVFCLWSGAYLVAGFAIVGCCRRLIKGV